MIIAFFLIAVRTFVQFICDDYATVSGKCSELLNKAVAETLPDIRSAYFLKVMEADDKAIQLTFDKYKIGFLASNTTYASEAEIINQACKMPSMMLEFLDWTAGVLPLFAVWVGYKISLVVFQRCKKKPIQVVEVAGVEMVEADAPPKDTPPKETVPIGFLSPLVPEYQNERDYRQEPLHKKVEKGIRRRRPPRAKKEGPSVLDTLTSLSPSLKNRIMCADPMV